MCLLPISSTLPEVVFSHFVVVDGRVVGSWKRAIEKKTAVITLKLFEPLSKAQSQVRAPLLNATAVSWGYPPDLLMILRIMFRTLSRPKLRPELVEGCKRRLIFV
ncbi:MAG: hypothetical protein DPW09_09025 [Anaerolineae bacterium]|nr:hypothetical protein [Anaerolineales bacterium]MCQ3973570.1 hypothetical protein [Anaerolineae bacterium]